MTESPKSSATTIPIACRNFKEHWFSQYCDLIKSLPSSHPTSYQLRKHLSHLLHIKQVGTRDMDRWNRECMALILQVWRKELELKPPKTMAVSRTTKSPPKGSSGTKPTRHSVLKQIYGNCPSGYFVVYNKHPQSVSHQNLETGFNYIGQTSIQVGTLLNFQAPTEFLSHLVPPFQQFRVRIGFIRYPGISTERDLKPRDCLLGFMSESLSTATALGCCLFSLKFSI